MANCNDCIHKYCCKYDRFFGVDEVENKCYYFKNKADFVEVPCRCGDCKNYNNHRYCNYFASTVFDDDYCSYGEQKNGKEQ